MRNNRKLVGPGRGGRRSGRGLTAAAAALPLALSACTSLDARPDVRRADDEVEARSGLRAGWADGEPAPPGEHPAAAVPARLTAREAAAIALRNDARLLAGVQAVYAARADLAQAGLLPNPVLALDLGFRVGGAEAGTKVGVGLTQQLASLLSRGARIDAADAALRAEVLSLSDRALETVARARAAHARLLSSQSLRAPLEETLREADRLVETTERRARAGEESTLGVNTQRLASLRLRAQAAERLGELEVRRRELLTAMGVPGWTGEFEALAPDEPPRELPGEAEIEGLVASLRLDVAAARARAEALVARVGAARRERFEMGAGPSYERTEDGARLLGPALEVAVPVLDTGEARVARTLADARAAEAEAEALRREAVGAARAAWARARAARDVSARYESEFLALAASNLEAARAAYASGEAAVADLVRAELELAEARQRMVDLRERAALADVELERALGGRR